MPRTFKSKYGRSYAYKRNKQHRGLQRLHDMQSHNSHRNINKNANQITWTNFNCKLKFGKNVGYCLGPRQVFNPANLEGYLDDYNWKKQTLLQYCERKFEQFEDTGSRSGSRYGKVFLDALKQIIRRGSIKRFRNHGRRYKRLD